MNCDNKISVFGASGFIGGRFCEMNKDIVEEIERNCYIPKTNNILFLISTNHNYNVYNDIFLDVETNLNILLKVLENAKKKYDNKFIINFVSSWFVYGKCKDKIFCENSVCDPRGFYSITKRTAEQLLVSYCETFNIEYRIFRLSNVIGTKNKFSKQQNAIQFLANELFYGRKVNLYNGGLDKRDFLYVDDISNALSLLLKYSKLNEIYNVGRGESHSFKQILDYIISEYNLDPTLVENIKPPAFHTSLQNDHIFLDITKLKNYGFVPSLSIYESIKQTINNMKIQ